MADFIQNYFHPIEVKSSSPDPNAITPIVTGNPLDYKRRGPDSMYSNGNAYNFDSYHYPKDLLSDNNVYGGNYIVFYINVQDASRLRVDGSQKQNSDFVSGDISASSSGLRSDVKTEKTGNLAQLATLTGAAAVSGFTGMGTGVSALDVAGAALVLTESATTSRETKRLKAAIAMHIPNQLATSYSVDWEGTDTAMEQMKSNMFGTDGAVTGIGVRKANIAGMVKTLQSSSMGGLVSAQTGLAANSKKEMLFKGVQFRTFSFDYKFAPRSADELKLVQNIILMFKFHMHPEYAEHTGNFLYLYPSEFDIMYYHNSQENTNLPRHTSCVLVGMNVSYTPNGNFTAFANGAATEISVTMQFKELAQLSKENIADGY